MKSSLKILLKLYKKGVYFSGGYDIIIIKDTDFPSSLKIE